MLKSIVRATGFVRILSVTTIIFGFASLAHADTSIVSAKPANVITVQVAMKSKTSFAKCENKKMSPTGRLSTVKGSKAIFAAALPKEDPKAAEAIGNGQSAWVCNSMAFNKEAAKFVRE